MGAQQGAAHFEPGDALFEQRGVIVGKGCLQGSRQLLGREDFGDAKGGTGPQGLDKEGIAQGCGPRCPLLGRGVRLHQVGGRYGHASRLGQLMGPVFIHTQGGRQHAAADDRDACQGKGALDRAVFPAAAVKDGESGVQGDGLDPAFGRETQQLGLGTAQG